MMDKWIEVLRVLLEQGVVPPEDVELIDENIVEIAKVTSILGEAFGDGLQWSDVTVIGEVVAPLMAIAKNLEETGSEKKAFVVNAVWLVYRAIDTWPDGKHNNVNLPFVIGPLERRVEHMVVTFAAGMAVDALYRRMKIAGEV